MAELKKYTNFDALKLDEQSGSADDRSKDAPFSEFEAFIKELQKEHSRKKQTKTDKGRQPD
ncbi:hypothetical protein GCM10023187_00070 [Nibrella viscosa]|uniref:Uncharacterized protein n=1 Tax=Nibrella viscosa TaxID=1084524 RepID=A0ABP8JQ42_9BACT